MLGNMSNVTPRQQCHPKAFSRDYIGRVSLYTGSHLYNVYNFRTERIIPVTTDAEVYCHNKPGEPGEPGIPITCDSIGRWTETINCGPS